MPSSELLRPFGNAGGRLRFPPLSCSNKGVFVQWPVVEDRRIKIRAVRPDNSSHFRVERDTREDEWVAERAVEVPFEDISKINDRLDPVIKAKPKRIGCNALASDNSMDGMSHGYSRGLMGIAERPFISC